MADKKMLLLGSALAALGLAACDEKKSSMGSGSAPASSVTAPMQVASGECWGINACKGKGDCGGEGHGCAGNNGCKGKGWNTMSKTDCDAKGGTFKGK